VKAGWEVKTLGDVCSFQRGLTYKKGDEVPHSKNRVLRANNIDRDTGTLKLNEIKYIRDDIDIPDAKKVQFDSLLICTASGSKSHLGKIALINIRDDYAFGGFMGQITPAQSIDPKFLYWFTQSNTYINFIDSLTDGANINNLRFNQLSNLQIPLPPLEEQKRIVSILDEAFEGLDRARENAEANLKNARELFESALNTQITNDLKKYGTKQISELCETIVDCLNRTAPKVPGPTDYKMVRTTNIRNGALNLEQVNYVEEYTYIAWTRRQTPAIGDVLLTREAPMGESAIIDTEDKIFLGQRIVSYRTKSEVLVPDYLLFCFQSKSMQDEFSRLGSGATVQHIRVPQSKELLVSCPPINQQSNAVSRLKQLLKQSKRLQFVHQTKLQDISDLRQSLLQKAFAGELT